MTSPLYGNQYSKRFNATFYIKAYDSDVTKPTDAATALSTFDGTAQESVFTVEAITDGDYVIMSSPTNAYCVWFDVDGAGTSKPTAPSSCTAYLQVEVATADISDVDAIGAAMETAFNGTDDLTASYSSASSELTVTAVQGGTVVTTPTDGDTGWATPVSNTAGVGDWSKIGGVMEDYSIEPSPNEIRDSVGNLITTYEDLDIEFTFMNINQRNVEILKDFNRTQVSIAIVDKTSSSYPKIYCVNDLTFNVSLNPSGDTANAPIKLAKRVEDALEGTDYWTYDTDIA